MHTCICTYKYRYIYLYTHLMHRRPTVPTEPARPTAQHTPPPLSRPPATRPRSTPRVMTSRFSTDIPPPIIIQWGPTPLYNSLLSISWYDSMGPPPRCYSLCAASLCLMCTRFHVLCVGVCLPPSRARGV